MQGFERLFEVKKESLKLLETQGYDIRKEKNLFTVNLRDFISHYTKTVPSDDSNEITKFLKDEKFIRPRSYLTNIYESTAKDTKVLVYFAISDEKKISDIDIGIFCRLILKFDVKNAIFISEVPSSTNIEDLCSEFVPHRGAKQGKNYGVFIQHFEDSELFYNPLEHALVPSHRLMSQEETDEFRKNEKINKGQIPRISALDSIAKRLGARPNDIIEITRKILWKESLIREEISYREVFMPHKEKKDRAKR